MRFTNIYTTKCYGIFLVAKQTKYLVFLQIILKKNVELSAFFFISDWFSELWTSRWPLGRDGYQTLSNRRNDSTNWTWKNMKNPLGIMVSNTNTSLRGKWRVKSSEAWTTWKPASLGAGWCFGLIALVQTTRLTGDYDFMIMEKVKMSRFFA